MQIFASALMGVFLLSGLAAYGAPAATSTTTTASSTAEEDVVPLSSKTLSVELTSYNAVPDQTDGTPFITASGAYSNPQVIAARSVDLAKELPFGTVIAIEQPSPQKTCGYSKVSHLIGYRVIADSMNIKMHNKVDVLLNQNDRVALGNKRAVNPSIVLGDCKHVTVRVVGHIKIGQIPSTQSALAALVRSQQREVAMR